MQYPLFDEATRIARLAPRGGRRHMVLDTDTYNEIDDQFAVVYALLSPEHLIVDALYAAPFWNDRSSGPADGMEKSYQEIHRLLERLPLSETPPVHRGSNAYLPGPDRLVESDAAKDLVSRAMAASPDDPLYVVAVGAITNVASAILMEPRIAERIVVVWLGGQPHWWHTAREFNLRQDLHASQLIFDSGVPLVQIPCNGVASHLLTTLAELEKHVGGRGAIGDYLLEIFSGYSESHFAWAKVIWDISAIGYLVDHSWVPTRLVHSPVLTDSYTWSVDTSRHLVRCAVGVNRNAVFGDLFRRIQNLG